VSKVVNDLLKFGVVQRGYLGIGITTITDELAKKQNLDDLNGVYVDTVNDGSSAQAAGLKAGDVITKINDEAVNSSPELQEMVSRYHPGDQITVTYKRDGKEKTTTAVLKNKEGNTSMVKKETPTSVELLGADFANLTSKEQKELGLDGGVKVVKLMDGKLARNTNMKEGFIITKIDNQPIKTIDDLNQALANKKGGVMIEGRYPDYPGEYYYAFGL